MRRLNVKLVVILATTSLVTIVLVAVVHAWQMQRTARVLLYQGRRRRTPATWKRRHPSTVNTLSTSRTTPRKALTWPY